MVTESLASAPHRNTPHPLLELNQRRQTNPERRQGGPDDDGGLKKSQPVTVQMRNPGPKPSPRSNPRKAPLTEHLIVIEIYATATAKNFTTPWNRDSFCHGSFTQDC